MIKTTNTIVKDSSKSPGIFFKMENDFKLFSVQTENCIPVWDIVRAEIWNYIIYNEQIKSKAPYKSKSIVAGFFSAFIKLIALLKVLFIKKRILFFGTSRFVNKDDVYYDPYLESVKPVIKNDFFLYETVPGKKKYKENGLFDVSFFLIKLLKPFLYKKLTKEFSNEKISHILIALYKTYATPIVSSKILTDIYYNFKIRYYLYSILLRLGGFKLILLHQNGFQKGLILAAHRQNIPVFEFQHADVIHYNIIWHYGFNHIDKENIIFPDVFLTYSDFWSDNNNIPSKCVEIGSAIHNMKTFPVKSNIISVISTKEHEDELNQLTINLALANPDLIFHYKLHPAQYDHFIHYEQIFEKYQNIEVLNIAVTIKDLIKTSDIFIVIYSSVMFELLQSGKNIFIYKSLNYWFFKQFFNLPLVFLFENPDDFRVKYYECCDKNGILMNQFIFYKPFNLNAFKNLLLVNNILS